MVVVVVGSLDSVDGFCLFLFLNGVCFGGLLDLRYVLAIIPTGEGSVNGSMSIGEVEVQACDRYSDSLATS